MTIQVSRAERKLILALLCVASFAVVFNNLVMAPLLPDISDDIGVRVAIAGLLVTGYAVVGGIAAIFSGPIIDRIGRKPVVVTGMSILTVATALSAVAPNFLLLLGSRALAGLGVACLTPAVFAAVGDYFEYEERGRAMSWVIAANSSASIFGVPVGAFISGVLSWRLTFGLLAGVLVVFVVLLSTKLPKDAPRAGSENAGMNAVGAVLRDRQTTMALFSNYLSTCYWFVFVTYMGAYFYDEFGLAKWALGGLTMVTGFGVVLGSNVGGRFADRMGKRPVILWSSALCAGFIFLVTTASPWLVAAAVFLFLFSTAGGARFASAQAVVSELAPSRRGTVMALNASGQQFGIVTGSALGGLVLTRFGYTGLGPTAAVLALLSLVSYARFVDERRFTPEVVQQVNPASIA
jgi:multidrug resistance protein